MSEDEEFRKELQRAKDNMRKIMGDYMAAHIWLNSDFEGGNSFKNFIKKLKRKIRKI